MVNNKIAQRAVAAGLSGLMAFGAAAPAALAYTNYDAPFKWVKTKSSDDSDHWKRLAGADRYGTMKAIVEAYNEVNLNFWQSLRKGYSDKDYYNYHNTVVLASGDNWPDALAANGLAGYLTNSNIYNGDFQSVPVLITKANSLSTETKDLLKGMQVQNVIIMGGTAAVSQDVEEAINKMGIGTQRVAGADRQETSVKALQRINGNWEARDKTYDLIIASGSNFADALSISPYAYRMGTPIILTDKDGKLTDQEVEAIKANDKIKEIVIVGGTEAVKDEVLGQIGTIKNNRAGINVVRVAGVDRYETSAKIAEFETKEWSKAWSKYAPEAEFTLDHAIVATGEKFPDALVGGQLAGGVNSWSMINVDGFSRADYNDWSPCPLLLTKDGDQHAESMIAQGLNKGRVEVGTDTFVSFGDWEDTIDNWYDGIAGDLISGFYDDTAEDWYKYTPVKFISDKAIDANLANGAGTRIVDVEEPTEITLKINIDNQNPGPVTVASIKDGGKDATLVDGTVDGSPMSDAQKARGVFTIKDLEWTIDGDDKSVKGGELQVVLTEQEVWTLLNAGTIEVKRTVDAVYEEETGVVDWQEFDWEDEIIGYVESDPNFYGIILGGKAAVSKDKQDKLEDLVKDYGFGADVYTDGWSDQGTIQRIDKKGVRNNYNYLDPKGYDVKGVVGGDFEGLFGDVYKIYGTNSYVVAVFDANDKLDGWLYYFDSKASVEADWSIDL